MKQIYLIAPTDTFILTDENSVDENGGGIPVCDNLGK